MGQYTNEIESLKQDIDKEVAIPTFNAFMLELQT